MNLKNKYLHVFNFYLYEVPHGGIQWRLLGEYKKETKLFTSKEGYQVNLKKETKIFTHFKHKEIKGYAEQSIIQLQHKVEQELKKCIRLKIGTTLEVTK